MSKRGNLFGFRIHLLLLRVVGEEEVGSVFSAALRLSPAPYISHPFCENLPESLSRTVQMTQGCFLPKESKVCSVLWQVLGRTEGFTLTRQNVVKSLRTFGQ